MENNFEYVERTPDFRDKKIEEHEESLRQDFFEHFNSHGYASAEPAPLVPKHDNTLIFTNSTIVGFKNLIENSSIPDPGLVVEQRCLRFQNLKGALDDSFSPKYPNYFKMLGLIGVHENKISSDVMDFLRNRLNISEDRLIILGTGRDRDLFKTWFENFSVVEDTQEKSFYNWKYGMDDVEGRGITICIKNDKGEPEDIGNMVAILKAGAVVGYEFGVGIEVALARKYGLKHPLAASRISEVIEFKNDPAAEKFQDLVMQAVILYSEGIRAGEGGARYLAKKIIKSLNILMQKLIITADTLYGYLTEYEKHEIGTNSEEPAQLILEDIRKYRALQETNRSWFEDYVRNQGRLGNLNEQVLREKGRVKYELEESVIDSILAREKS